MRSLSKSRLLAFRQCPKRLWLEINQPEVRVDSADTAASYTVGNTVGEVARRLYDPEAVGTFVDVAVLGVDGAVKRTRALLGLVDVSTLGLDERQPIFEAGV